MRLPSLLRLGVFGACALALFAGGYAARPRVLPDGPTLPGLLIDGEEVAMGASARALIEQHARTLGDRRVKLVLPAGPGEKDRVVAEASLAELGVKVLVDETLARAAVGTSGDLVERALLAERARHRELDVPLALTTDASSGMPLLLRLKETWDTSPVSARLDLDHHATVPERAGRYIDADRALAAALRLAGEKGAFAGAPPEIALTVASFAPRISTDYVAKLDISAVLGEYETYFSRQGEQARRGKNIDVASSKLDGVILSPGELVSFNQLVGERSEQNGFQKSWEIFKGEMVEGVGGGTCQVASTFHAVAFFGGLDVLERLPHSRPSAYIPMGLDSTVVYPAVDLKLRNPHPFPVVVHARTEGNKLKIELLGASRPVRVAFGRELLATVPYARKVIEEPWLAGKKVIVKQHGIRGYRIKRRRLLTYPDKTTRTEETTDFYPPTTEIYQVPVGFDVAMLPALPAGDTDSGEGSDTSAKAATSAQAAAPASTATPSTVACTGDCAKPAADPTGLELVDGPGSHAPTAGQANPVKSMWLSR